MKKGIGAFLRKERLEVGKTMEEIANFSGLSQPYISQIENEKRVPSIESLGKIIIAISKNVTIEKAGEPIPDMGFSFNSLEIEYYYQEQILAKATRYLTSEEAPELSDYLQYNDFITDLGDYTAFKNWRKAQKSREDSIEVVEIPPSHELKNDLTPIIEQSYKENIYKLDGYPLTKEEFQTLKTVLTGIIYLRKQ